VAPRGSAEPRRRRGRPPIPDDWIEPELRRVCQGRERFPTAAELERLGHTRLRYALRRRGVIYWAERIGLPLGRGQDRARPFTEADALAEVQAIVAAQGSVPHPDVLRKAGHPRLASYLEKRGGVRAFCAKHGISLPATRGWRAV